MGLSTDRSITGDDIAHVVSSGAYHCLYLKDGLVAKVTADMGQLVDAHQLPTIAAVQNMARSRT